MRRQRSESFFADTQEEFFEEMNHNKTILERRRYSSCSYQFNNSNKSNNSNNSENLLKKKYFRSYDNLENNKLE